MDNKDHLIDKAFSSECTATVTVETDTGVVIQFSNVVLPLKEWWWTSTKSEDVCIFTLRGHYHGGVDIKEVE